MFGYIIVLNSFYRYSKFITEINFDKFYRHYVGEFKTKVLFPQFNEIVVNYIKFLKTLV